MPTLHKVELPGLVVGVELDTPMVTGVVVLLRSCTVVEPPLNDTELPPIQPLLAEVGVRLRVAVTGSVISVVHAALAHALTVTVSGLDRKSVV